MRKPNGPLLPLLLATCFMALAAPVFSFNSAHLKSLLALQTCPDCDLTSANLSGLDLSNADLSGSLLLKADLTDANLRRADLSGANLIDARLHGANLHGANLAKAYWINGKKCRDGSIGRCKQR